MTDVGITAEPQNDPNQCKFVVDRKLAAGGFRFKSAQEAAGSSLAEEIFKLDGVTSVFVAGNIITVTKLSQEFWQSLGKQVGQAIRTAIASGKNLIAQNLLQNVPPNDEIRMRVKKVLDESINPAVAGHGGYIELIDVQEGNLFIRMSGGCQGCGMAAATLKNGVEEAIRKELPNIGAIYDATDHAGGSNPYFAH